VAWMAVIFLLSAQPSDDSSALSGSILAVVAGMVDGALRLLGGSGLTPESQVVLHAVVRKGAHVVAYLVLGLLAARAVTREAGRSRLAPWALAWLLATAYAVTDEVHQLFVPGRGGQVWDILLDSAGALAGVLLHRWWSLRESRRTHHTGDL